MSHATSPHRLVDVARAYVAMLRRHETPNLETQRQALNPYRAAHMAACWEAGWLSYSARRLLGEGFTAPELGRQGRAAWLRGYRARSQCEVPNQPQED